MYFSMYTAEHVNKWANLSHGRGFLNKFIISTGLGPWRAGIACSAEDWGPFGCCLQSWADHGQLPVPTQLLPSLPPQQGRKPGGKAHGWQQGGHLPITIMSKTGKSIYCLLKQNWSDSTRIRLQIVGAPELYIHYLLIQVLFQEDGGQSLCREPRFVGHWLGVPAGMEVRVTLAFWWASCKLCAGTQHIHQN